MNNQQNDPDLMEAFAILTRPQKGKMREEVFRRDFLPFISPAPLPKEDVDFIIAKMDRNGERRHNQLDMRTQVINQWLKTVGSPYNVCEVFSESGELLFTVPALFTRNELMDAEDIYRLPMLIEQAALRSRVHDKIGDNFVKTEIEPLFYPPEVPEDFKNQWNAIFKYYGLPSFGQGGDPVVENKSEETDIDDDYDQVFDYD